MAVSPTEKSKVGAEGGRDASRELFSVVVREADELSWHLKQDLNAEREQVT